MVDLNKLRERQGLIARQTALHQREEAAAETPAVAAPAEAPAPALSKSALKRQAKAQCLAEEEVRRAAKAAREAEEAARRAAKAEKQAQAEKDRERGRLPNGSRFNVAYDAEAVLWRGSLTVPGAQGAAVFEAEAGAVFKLLRDLDSQYRAALTAGAAGPNQEAVR